MKSSMQITPRRHKPFALRAEIYINLEKGILSPRQKRRMKKGNEINMEDGKKWKTTK
jgi:hypothetical protein